MFCGEGVGEWHRFANDISDVRVLRVDTDRGTHGSTGPVLQPAVRSLLEQATYRFEARRPPHEGVFLIDPRSGDLIALAAASVNDVLYTNEEG